MEVFYLAAVTTLPYGIMGRHFLPPLHSIIQKAKTLEPV
jgi:hypothetical protein